MQDVPTDGIKVDDITGGGVGFIFVFYTSDGAQGYKGFLQKGTKGAGRRAGMSVEHSG